MTDAILAQQQLHEVLDYNPDTGLFFWKQKKQGRRLNKVAGCAISDGYIIIRFNKKNARAHRLAWVYVYGDIPDGMYIDHINRDRSDNRICNLRLVDALGSCSNRKPQRKKFEPRNRVLHKITAANKILEAEKTLG
jgi:hypothetical protein